MRYVLILIIFLAPLQEKCFAAKLKQGWYRGVLVLNEKENAELPFTFELKRVNSRHVIVIHNGEEKIVVDEIIVTKDSCNFRMPVFDTEFRSRISKTGLEGVFINHYRAQNNVIPFKALFGQNFRFAAMSPLQKNPFAGKWEVTFSPNGPDSSKAIGRFSQSEGSNLVSGTFQTETGDYRFLEGAVVGDELLLSTFNGSSAYLFVARLNQQGDITGSFYSGRHWKENWSARRNDKFELRDPNSITTLKDPAAPISFSFPDTKNATVSLSDSDFYQRPVIIQLMGTWCANCLDEARYFKTVHEQYHQRGLRIIALSFEKTADAEKAVALCRRFSERLQLPFPVLITSETAKQKAARTFPQLSNINAFPTTIFLNRSHKVVRIHSGFNGPATGQAYKEFTEETESLIRQLLQE